MKAVPFISTMLNHEYRVFVSEFFNFLQIEDLFKDWILKDMVGWYKVINYNNDIEIQFYGHGNNYKIKNPNLMTGGEKELILPYPNNLDEFICDCRRCLVDLEWTESTISKMNRSYFMEQSQLKEYNEKILNQIDKS